MIKELLTQGCFTGAFVTMLIAFLTLAMGYAIWQSEEDEDYDGW